MASALQCDKRGPFPDADKRFTHPARVFSSLSTKVSRRTDLERRQLLFVVGARLFLSRGRLALAAGELVDVVFVVGAKVASAAGLHLLHERFHVHAWQCQRS